MFPDPPTTEILVLKRFHLEDLQTKVNISFGCKVSKRQFIFNDPPGRDAVPFWSLKCGGRAPTPHPHPIL